MSLNVITLIFKAYLVDQTVDHLSATLRKGGIKDLLAFFPQNRQDTKFLEEHFKKEGLPQIAEWWAKKQYAVLKEELTRELKELCEGDDTPEQVGNIMYAVFIYSQHQPRLSESSKFAKRPILSLNRSWCSASGKVSCHL